MLGSFTFILHTHLPYVLHHGKWPFGSDWLTEAVAECYIPILEAMDELDRAGIAPKISMDFSPVNLEQLADPAFVGVFTSYCDEKIAAAEKDHAYFLTNGEEELLPLADYWLDFYTRTKSLFLERYGGNIVAGFRSLANRGILDAMTCGATHGYFPLLLHDSNIRAQLKLANATHQHHFGKPANGVWLPECGYRPAYHWTPKFGPQKYREQTEERYGVEELVAEAGLKYFVVDGALTKGGITMPAYQPQSNRLHDLFEMLHESPINRAENPDRSLSAIYWVRSSTRDFEPPAVFSRDARTAAMVWSADSGYPGHPPYLEFHKKHHNSGLRYWSVTHRGIALDKKLPYDPEAIDKQVNFDAMDFVWTVRTALEKHQAQFGTPGIVASPFDAELFGHWWFEGPKFLKRVCELLADMPEIELTHCSEALQEYSGERVEIAIPEGSWGEGGQHFVWTNPEVAWMWDFIYPAEDRFAALLARLEREGHPESDDELLRALSEQAGRELLLLESSDWEFLISTEGAIDYAKERFTTHLYFFNSLVDMIERYLSGSGLTEEDTELMEMAIAKDRPFEKIDLGWWR